MDQPEQSDLDLKTMDVAASLDLDQIRQLAETLGDESWRTEEILRRGLPSFPPPRFTPSDFPFQLSSSSFSGLAVEVFLGLCL
jgi:DNA-directed RNA polymerase beta' subunit